MRPQFNSDTGIEKDASRLWRLSRGHCGGRKADALFPGSRSWQRSHHSSALPVPNSLPTTLVVELNGQTCPDYHQNAQNPGTGVVFDSSDRIIWECDDSDSPALASIYNLDLEMADPVLPREDREVLNSYHTSVSAGV